MVRVIETWGDVSADVFDRVDAEIVILYSDGKKEIVELDRKGSKNFHSNTIIIHQTMDPFFSEEYELLSEQSSGGSLWSTHTWIFRKIEAE
jgi:hypothetical protein